MPELGPIQEAFAAALADPAQAARVAALFSGAPADAIDRLGIYRGNVAANARKALANAYPIVVQIVGETFFEGLAREYLRRHPSTSGDLNAYGEHFPAFVAEFPHTQDLPYLPDVARMEWLAHRAHYAGDSAPFDARRLGSIPPGAWRSLRPVLAPACALLESRWPIARIWEVHQEDYSGEFSVDLESGPARVLVYRPGYRVAVSPLPVGAFVFLQRAACGDSIATALDAAVAAEPRFDLPVALHSWVDAGVVVDLRAD